MERQYVLSYFFAFFLFINVDSFSGGFTVKRRISDPCVLSSGKRGATELKANGHYDDVGLLKGVEYDADIKDEERGKYYAPVLTMSSLVDFDWINTPGYAWEAVKEDAERLDLSPEEYLDYLQDNMLAYQVSDEIFDREELYNFLNSTIKKRGTFALVLGGKSVSKSLVLKNYSKWLQKNNETGAFPMLLNGRKFSGFPLATGILQLYQDSLKGNAGFQLTFDLENWIKVLGGILDLRLESDAKDVKDLLQSEIEGLLKQNRVTSTTALVSFVKLVENGKYPMQGGKYPVLIIDEANEVKDLGYHEKEDVMPNMLQTIVSLMKEEKRLSVIMASSEHAYPYTLERGLNLLDISDKIYAGEIPPSSMWQLLVKEEKEGEKVIGMGPSLAKVMMSAYGGHYYRMLNAVCDLSHKRGKFVLNQRLDEISQKIITCLKGGGRNSEKLLYSMAKYGFADVTDYEDGYVKQIAEKNIGGVASRTGSTIVGVAEL